MVLLKSVGYVEPEPNELPIVVFLQHISIVLLGFFASL